MKRRRKLTRVLTWTLAIALLPILWLIFFFYSTDAPITHGHIEYGVSFHNDLKLDIYHPTVLEDELSPPVLFIHGGAWIGGRKESINVNRINGAINRLRASGHTIISPEYTLARDGKSPFPDCIQDGFMAIDWINTHADSLKLDMSKFGIIGESAGGHIAMMTTFANPKDFGLPNPKITPTYLVDIYGPNDLVKLYHSTTVDSLQRLIQRLPEPLKQSMDLPALLFGFNPIADTARTLEFAKKYSPIQFVNQDVPPVLVIHGDADIVVPIDQSLALVQRLEDLGGVHELQVLPEVNHAFHGATDHQKDSIQYWIYKFVIDQTK